MRFVKGTLIATVAIAFTIYFVRAFDSRSRMPLSVEHRIELVSEFHAGDEMNWDEYLRNEAILEEESLGKLS